MGEPLPVMQPVNTEREDVNDAERQQQNIPQQQDAQDIGDMLVEEEILDQEEMHVQEEPVVEERMSAWSHATDGWMDDYRAALRLPACYPRVLNEENLQTPPLLISFA